MCRRLKSAVGVEGLGVWRRAWKRGLVTGREDFDGEVVVDGHM